MSVVNRMLQDIDRRLGEPGVQSLGAPAAIRSVPMAQGRPREARTAWTAAALFAILAGAAMTWGRWQEWRDEAHPPPPAVASPAKVARVTPPPVPSDPAGEVTPASAEATAPAESPAADAPSPEPQAPSPASPVEPARVEIAQPARVEIAPEPPPPRERTQARATGAPSSPETLKLSLQLSEPPPEALRARGPTAGPALRGSIAIRHVAADETVQAAHALWNEGAPGAALATLREALATAESTRNTAAAATLAREQARLEVADNRPQAALDLLRRMEPALAGDADALALRGNAEQRLALHADAAASYLAALRLRPAEGRWMLGAAISLAAGGNLDAARDWVGRARERGALTPQIASYLQELGVKVNP